jgi:hypothetical protein
LGATRTRRASALCTRLLSRAKPFGCRSDWLLAIGWFSRHGMIFVFFSLAQYIVLMSTFTG